jgi:UDP-2-acetamido-3-amino-2,3-dideoxy-glucuronate N-acetyltransferase
MIHETCFIHPRACVDETVEIGAGSRVWQFATVIRGTVLGKGCNVGSSATLDGPIIGDRCIISPGVDMGPGFLIGDDVFLGPNVVLCNDAWPRTHKDGWTPSVFRGEANGWYGMDPPRFCVIIEGGSSIGANAVILPGVRIGRGAMVAAGSVVSRDVPPRSVWRSSKDIRPIGNHQPERMRFAR